MLLNIVLNSICFTVIIDIILRPIDNEGKNFFINQTFVTQHSKIRNKSGLLNLANQLQSARMGIFGWKGRFSDIGEFS